jgi:hypothetical protein
MTLCHTYPSREVAEAALADIDAARPATETATTYHGPKQCRALCERGLLRRVAPTVYEPTEEGIKAGLTLVNGQVVETKIVPAKVWAVKPIELVDGTYAVPVCDAVEGRRIGKRTIPHSASARVATPADVKRQPEEIEEPVKK